MFNGGVEAQALFLKKSGKRKKKGGGNTSRRGTNILQIPTEAVLPACDHSAPSIPGEPGGGGGRLEPSLWGSWMHHSKQRPCGLMSKLPGFTEVLPSLPALSLSLPLYHLSSKAPLLAEEANLNLGRKCICY